MGCTHHSVVFFDKGHVGVILLLLLGPGQIDPRQQTINKETKWVLVHIQLLALWTRLLIILDIVQVYPLNSITEIIFVYVGVPAEVEGYSHCLSLLQAQALQVLLVVKLLLHLVQDHPQGSLDPKHHIVALPEDLRPLNVNF